MALIGSVWDQTSWDIDAWQAFTWASASAPPVVTIPPSPTQLVHHLVANVLDMPIPLIFTQNETGPIELALMGADGTPEDLSTAISVTLRVADYAGTPIVNGVALTDGASDGTCVWTRLTAQVQTAGDYRYQVRVVRADGSIGYYPDAQLGMPLTILPVV